MAFNLIHERWIPVRRASGKRQDWIAPWEITEPKDDPPVALDAARPDFNGALIQFLIGLVQTAFAPKDDEEWRKYLHQPPLKEDLRRAFAAVGFAFDLDGDEPRFMQVPPMEGAEEMAIGLLLLDSPAKETSKENKDHFVKRVDDFLLCARCTAAALFNLQVQSPQGGRGYFVSVRGGGPLTTLLLGGNLWQTICLNILVPEGLAHVSGDAKKTDTADWFPWMSSKGILSRDERRILTPLDAHPLHMFWGMPRRIRLGRANGSASECSICRQRGQRVFMGYQRKSEGIQYKGWVHSLSPFYRDPKGGLRSQRLHTTGFAYRYWSGWVVADKESERHLAPVVEEFLSHRAMWPKCHEVLAESPRIWTFGYATDSAKVLAWGDGSFPLYVMKTELRSMYEDAVLSAVGLADRCVFCLRSCARQACFSEGSSARGDWSFIDSRFWKETEAGFYVLLERFRQSLEQGQSLDACKIEWLRMLSKAAVAIFDDVAQTSQIADTNPKRVALARRSLGRSLSETSKSIRAILGLSVEARP